MVSTSAAASRAIQIRLHPDAKNATSPQECEPRRRKKSHSIYDGVQCSAGPHGCDTLIVVREIVPPDVHWFALRRQQLLRDLALGLRQRGGYPSEALL